MENEKLRKYDILASELGSIYKCTTKIIPYVMTWEGVVTKFHKQYLREVGVDAHIQAYTQIVTIKKTLELVSLEYRRSICDDEREVKDEILTSIDKICQSDVLEVPLN